MEISTMDKNWKIETMAIQAGYEPKDGEPRVMPIVQSTTFKYDNAQCVADLFDLKREGFFYTRLANPTVDAFEKKIAAMEGGVAAVALAAGLLNDRDNAHRAGHILQAHLPGDQHTQAGPDRLGEVDTGVPAVDQDTGEGCLLPLEGQTVHGRCLAVVFIQHVTDNFSCNECLKAVSLTCFRFDLAVNYITARIDNRF